MQGNTDPIITRHTEQSMPPAKEHGKRAADNTVLLIILSVVSICTLLGLLLTVAFSLLTTLSLSKTTYDMKKQVDQLSSRVEHLNDENTRLWIASDMYGSGVTDSFYSMHVVFYDNDIVTIDVDVQSDYESNYAGKGKFNAGDDELKAELMDFIGCFRESYENAKSSSMADFSSLEIRLTIYGYDIGTYKNGALTLAD